MALQNDPGGAATSDTLLIASSYTFPSAVEQHDLET